MCFSKWSRGGRIPWTSPPLLPASVLDEQPPLTAERMRTKEGNEHFLQLLQTHVLYCSESIYILPHLKIHECYSEKLPEENTLYCCHCFCLEIGDAFKRWVGQMFIQDVMEKPERTFWPTQCISCAFLHFLSFLHREQACVLQGSAVTVIKSRAEHTASVPTRTCCCLAHALLGGPG